MRKFETTINIYDRACDDLGIERIMVPIPFTVDLDSVYACRPEIKEGSTVTTGIEYDGTIIYIHGGDSFWISESFEKINFLIFGNAKQ